MMMTARALLDRNPDPSDGEIREAISGQICRCTGYATIVRSVHWAADHEQAARLQAEGGGAASELGEHADPSGASETPATVDAGSAS
jgi:aerobic carbon-monoxide dehydrogenase small subunit